jgi:hypothetical protein
MGYPSNEAPIKALSGKMDIGFEPGICKTTCTKKLTCE